MLKYTKEFTSNFDVCLTKNVDMFGVHSQALAIRADPFESQFDSEMLRISSVSLPRGLTQCHGLI